MRLITAELILQKKKRRCGWNIPKSSIMQTAKRNRGKKPADIQEKTDILFMKSCYENCQQDCGGIIMGKILDEDLIYEILSVVEEIPEGKVAAYGQIARLIGRDKNSRLAGKVLGK